MGRVLSLLYGVFCYVFFLVVFLYAIGFMGNIMVPKSIDSIPSDPLGQALLVDLGLLLIFAVQHSLMARPSFKARWTKIVPKQVERSTYVLFSNVLMILLFIYWQPLGGTVWEIENSLGRGIMWAIFGFGWGLLLLSTFMINHFDLFGLRQVWLHFRNQPYSYLKFNVRGPYHFVRHPLYVGWICAFWGAPVMTSAHLVFALATTAYILIAIQLEERNLVEFHGEDYREYRRQVPMLIPNGKKYQPPQSAAHRG